MYLYFFFLSEATFKPFSIVGPALYLPQTTVGWVPFPRALSRFDSLSPFFLTCLVAVKWYLLEISIHLSLMISFLVLQQNHQLSNSSADRSPLEICFVNGASFLNRF